MRKEDVILGSRIGNSSNPIVLEANSWVRYVRLKNKIILIKIYLPFLHLYIYKGIVFAMKLYFHNYFFSKIKSMQFWIFFLPTLFKSIALRCLLLIQDKLWDQIHVEVRDFRYYVQPLIFHDSFHDFNLHTGDNILSQNWRQRRLTSQFNSSNDFRSSNFYVLIIQTLQRFRAI